MSDPQKALNVKRAYQVAFSTPEGKRVLDDLIKQYLKRSPMVQTEPYTTHFNLGKQQLVQAILQKVYGSDRAYIAAISESYETQTPDL